MSADKVGLSSSEIFEAAAAAFQDGLPESTKALYTPVRSSEELHSFLDEYVQKFEKKEKRWLLSACQAIDKFGQTMKSYFEVVDILVSSHPEYAAIIWGAVKLVFQLSSNYARFFEKIAMKYQELAGSLPVYTRQIELLRNRAKLSSWRPSHERLLKSLSYIYTDILQFSFDACQLFTSKSSGMRRRAKVAMDLFWTPFDVRFSKILDRFAQHKQLYEAGLQEVYTEEMLLHYDTVDLAIQQNVQKRVEKEADYTEKERQELLNAIACLKIWVGAPDWQSSFDLAVQRRHQDTGQWFLSDPIYRQFVNPSSDVAQEPPPQILHILGKPGFGKTILSTVIIDNLRGIHRSTQSPGERSRILAFYHFEQQKPKLSWGVSAFRAVITQIIHACRNERDIIDIATIVMQDTGSGQITASQEDLLMILDIYAKRLELDLVFDGLDECLDWQELLNRLEKLAENTTCKIILLGRPHAQGSRSKGVPKSYLSLKSDSNSDDLESFLEPKISALLDSGAISGNLKLSELIPTLVSRANGMFLWVTLMANYLSSQYLTPLERREAIDNIMLFDGLDAMFKMIFEERKAHLTSNQWEKLRRVFKCLVVGKGSWTTDTLNIALAVHFDRPFDDADMMQNFEFSIVQLCASLVEVRIDKTVEFIHSSVAEFFEASTRSRDGFSIRRDDAHCTLALLCLSYLYHDVPHGPLSGDENTIADVQSLSARLPMIRYSVLYWPFHMSRCLNYLAKQSSDAVLPSDLIPCFSALSAILGRNAPEFLTMWIEASWVFKVAPDLVDLSESIKSFCEWALSSELVPTSLSSKHLGFVVDRTRKLALDLGSLNHSWGHVLRSEPNEIWLPSIKAFSKSMFWSETAAQHVQSLTAADEQGSILISSQISSDGSLVGIIRVWRPMSIENSMTPTWRVLYKIWSLRTLSELCKFWFEIPQTQIPKAFIKDTNVDAMVNTDIYSPSFRFPVAFSSSLRQVIILDVVFKIDQQLTTVQDYTCHSEVLPAVGCSYRCLVDLTLWHWPTPPIHWQLNCTLPRLQQFHARHNVNCHKDMEDANKDCFQWFIHQFSPDERFIISLEGHSPLGDFDTYRKRVLTVFELDHDRNYIPLATVAVQIILRSNQQDNSILRFICFHPHQPIVAISMLSETTIWHFTENESQLIPVYRDSLENITFSRCGNFLAGNTAPQGKPIFFSVSSLIPPPSVTMQSSITQSLAGNSEQTQVIVHAKQGAETAVQSSLLPVFDASDKKPQLSALRQQNKDGIITLQTIRDNGSTIQQTLTRIPYSTTLEQSFSTLVNSNSSENARLVLNMAAQESYTADNTKVDFILPAVIDRKIDTIPVATSEAQQPLAIGPIRRYNSIPIEGERPRKEFSKSESSQFPQRDSPEPHKMFNTFKSPYPSPNLPLEPITPSQQEITSSVRHPNVEQQLQPKQASERRKRTVRSMITNLKERITKRP